MGQFVIRLKDGQYWIAKDTFAGHIDAATKYETRWLALGAMGRAGPVMHGAAILPYQRPGEREEK